MDQQEINLIATFKTVAGFGAKYAAEFPATSPGGIQFAVVAAAIPTTATLGAAQLAGADQKHGGVLSKAVARVLIHEDLVTLSDAAHSLALLGVPGLEGKFHLPRSGGDQAWLNAARVFNTDATALKTKFLEVGLLPDFPEQFAAHISALEAAISSKGSGTVAESGATGGLEDTTHKAAIALTVLNTIVRNTFKKSPIKLAEWVTASHVEKHTPVSHAKPTPPPVKL